MATLAEIESVLGVIAFGYTAELNTPPSIEAFQTAYFSKAGKAALKQKVTVLHCTTEYPAPVVDINLNAMRTLANAFHLPVGYSDHSAGITIPIAATACGAVLIEKHFTLDKEMEGPDHQASLEPGELAQMVRGIRDVELALGDGIKGPCPSEIKNKAIARKSIIAMTSIEKGQVFDDNNLTIKRPGHGINPNRYWEMQGKVATRSYIAGDIIGE